ncbi:DNA polymerase ligase-domain-containing protein [Mariannaea sp. PMI_226]|nr:DNA polymerase ligase-domain-containing protein [Mariannaea sp. PMI_226]
MPDKRPASPELIANPFVKKRNLEWTLVTSNSSSSLPSKQLPPPHTPTNQASTSAIESGSVRIEDHLTHFSNHLGANISSSLPSPLLSISSFVSLYTANAGNPNGAHFVIHQHDHPIAGTHYDLRLQINENSSVSWAIMYGLPGDPNSSRLNRNATETRIHCLWNHLVETASSATGSLLIWDTGTYCVLPRRSKYAPADDPSSPPSSPLHAATESSASTPQALLHEAFQTRKINLRLFGSRLPDPYILKLRLTKSEDAAGRAISISPIKRRRRRRAGGGNRKHTQPETTDEENEGSDSIDKDADIVPATTGHGELPSDDLSAMEREIQELEDEQVRKTNAYPGAKNTIGSIHQRRWYLSLDRQTCGFTKKQVNGRPVWVPNQSRNDNDKRVSQQTSAVAGRPIGEDSDDRLSFPFHVRGPNHERSVVTGRRAADVLRDEGVEKFVSRKGWTPVLN